MKIQGTPYRDGSAIRDFLFSEGIIDSISETQILYDTPRNLILGRALQIISRSTATEESIIMRFQSETDESGWEFPDFW